ncbi:MAG: hypothetical protein L6Q84_17060 [Polyangiaceae bacterium]|nr:hypothetical protein [Polyangiaceae bacterium]
MRLFLAGLFLLAACSSSSTTVSPDDDAGACENLSGKWDLKGCLVQGCDIAQTGCDAVFACKVLGVSGTSQGKVSGKEVTFEGDLKCSLAIAGDTLAGECTSDAGKCTLSGQRL